MVEVAAAPHSQTAAADSKPVGEDADLPPLIPLNLLLGLSKQRNVQLSPDGRHLAYIRAARDSGVYNVFVKPLPPHDELIKAAAADPRSLFDREGVERDLQVTTDRVRGITNFQWGKDSKSILFMADNNGDENDHLFLVRIGDDIKSGATRTPLPVDLTPLNGVKASGLISSKAAPDLVYVGLNVYDQGVFDLYRINVTSGKIRLDTVNPGGVTSWLTDGKFRIRGAVLFDDSDGSSSVIVKTRDDSPQNFSGGFERWVAQSYSGSDTRRWPVVAKWPFGEKGEVFGFNKAGDALYVASSLGRDTTELQLIAAEPSGRVLKRIASSPLSDVDSVVFDSNTYEPQMVSFNYLKNKWLVLDLSLKQDWERISSMRPGESAVLHDISNDHVTWLVSFSADNTTSRHYLFRRGSWPPMLLGEVQPEIARYKLGNMNPVIIVARDGLKLPSYLTLPVKPGIPQGQLPPEVAGPLPPDDLDNSGRTLNRGAGSSNSGSVAAAAEAAGGGAAHFATRAEREAAAAPGPLNLSLPLVLLVHGGPWARDLWGGSGSAQWLANRGAAVLQVNFRGSDGFGKAFLSLGNRQWGVGSMQNDLTDAVKWAVAKGIADSRRVCIMGASYGGYAALAGLAFTPELYACGVDAVGMSDVGAFMRSFPPYWTKFEWLARVGDAAVNQTLNREISPVFHAARIRAPLLIAQGGNDPRVKRGEADGMFEAMKSHSKAEVTYVLYPDEGHGLVRPANRMDFFSRADQFLARHLGTRAEPPRDTRGTSAEVLMGERRLAAKEVGGGSAP